MNPNKTITLFYQAVEIDDYRYKKDCDNIDYSRIADDCETKTISLLGAIKHISLSISGLSEMKKDTSLEVNNLSYIIADLAELAIATNKTRSTADEIYNSQVRDHV